MHEKWDDYNEWCNAFGLLSERGHSSYKCQSDMSYFQSFCNGMKVWEWIQHTTCSACLKRGLCLSGRDAKLFK